VSEKNKTNTTELEKLSNIDRISFSQFAMAIPKDNYPQSEQNKRLARIASIIAIQNWSNVILYRKSLLFAVEFVCSCKMWKAKIGNQGL
jgi:hypothetical protein